MKIIICCLPGINLPWMKFLTTGTLGFELHSEAVVVQLVENLILCCSYI